jgi:hypothetical protein
MNKEQTITELSNIRDNLNEISKTHFNNLIESSREVTPERYRSNLKEQEVINQSITTLTVIICNLLEDLIEQDIKTEV